MRDGLVWLFGVIWFGGVTVGLLVWDRYENTPGTLRTETSPLESAPGGWRLTVFLHPRCPCSRATLGELAEVVEREPGLAIRVVFVRPEDVADGWEKDGLWDEAISIRGIEVACDPDGSEARQAGAETSGHAVLVDPAGRVVFRGGLTRGRGRAGDDFGRRVILNWIQQGSGPVTAPVYGCALFHSVE